MRELLDDLDRWKRQQVRVALARVVELDGSEAPGPGGAMAVNEHGEFAGSVTGGVEGAVVAAALAVLKLGRPKLVTFGYSGEEAFSTGLTCGGRIHVFLEPLEW